MTDFIKQLGLGIILDFTNRGERNIASTRQNIQGLKSDTEKLTKSFGGQIDQLGGQMTNLGGLIKSAFAAAGGAVALKPLKDIIIQALESQRQMRDLTTTLIAQDTPLMIISEKVEKAQKRIWAVNREVPGMLDQMESASGRLFAALGEKTALEAFDPIAKLAFIANRNRDFAGTMDVVTNALYKFRPSIPGKNDIEKINNIGDAFAKMKKYRLDIGETGDILIRASKDASLFGLSFYEMLSLIAPAARQSSMPRMAASAVANTLETLAQYPEAVKEFKKKKKQGPMTMADMLGLSEEEDNGIPAKSRWLLNLKVTTPQGTLLPFLNILKQVEKGSGASKELIAKIDALLKEGKISPEDALTKGFGIDVTTASLMQRLLGQGIGLLLGRSGEIEQIQSEISRSAGLVQRTFETEMEEAASQVDLLKGQFSSLKDQLGEKFMPAIDAVVTELNKAAKSFGGWMEENPKSATAVAWGGGTLSTAVAAYGGYKGFKYAKEFLSKGKKPAEVVVERSVKAASTLASEAAKKAGVTFSYAEKAATEITKQSAKESIFGSSAARTTMSLAGKAASRVVGGVVGALIWPEPVGPATLSEWGLAGGANLPPDQPTQGLPRMTGVPPWQLSFAPHRAFVGTALSRVSSEEENGVIAKLDSIDRTLMEMKDGRSASGGIVTDTVSGGTLPGKTQVMQSFSGDFYIVVPQGASPEDTLQMFEKYTRDQADRSATGKF